MPVGNPEGSRIPKLRIRKRKRRKKRRRKQKMIPRFVSMPYNPKTLRVEPQTEKEADQARERSHGSQ
jgi:hypothetical protein